MGAIVSYMRHKDEVLEFIPFTQDDIENIKRKWIIPQSKPMDIGENILYKYFETWPDYQNYFEHFKNSPLITLKGAPGFRTHACRMIRVFDATVDILHKDDYEFEMERIWIVIARTHFQKHVPQKAFRDFKRVAVQEMQKLCDLTIAEYNSFDKFFTNVHFIIADALETMSKASRNN